MAEKFKCPVCGSTSFATEKSKTKGFEHVDVGVCSGEHNGKPCPYRFDTRTHPATKDETHFAAHGPASTHAHHAHAKKGAHHQ